jgi:hypothetical protein
MLQLYEVNIVKKDNNFKNNIDNALYYLQHPPCNSFYCFYDCV